MSEYIDVKKEGIWEHFKKEKHGQTAQCKICQTVLKTTGGSTKGLHEHMKRIHDVNVLKRKEPEPDDRQPSTSTSTATAAGPMTKYLLKNSEQSLPAVLSRMTACDGLSFNVFVTSKDLRRALMAMGFSHLPNTHDGIKQHVMQHGQRVRSVVSLDMKRLKDNGERFSVTLDEWTSTRNRRYMNVNVHAKGGKFWSLGLVRVLGSMPAEKCVELLETKLGEFGLSLEKDIVCICTDGASVMRKVGKLISAEQQLCYAHTLQLAVLDVLYKRRPVSYPCGTATDSAQSAENDEVDEKDDEADNDAAEPAVDDDGHGLELQLIDDTYDMIVEMSDEYHTVVKKVRSIVKIFKQSPTKNDAILQPYVKREFGKDISLVLDCCTRWSSLYDMLSRFLKLRSAVQKALIDLNESVQVQLTDGDFTVIQEVASALEPLQLAVKALCRRDTNLVGAEAALSFCLVELQKQRSELAKTLAMSVEKRVTERRSLHAGVMQYLHCPTARANATELMSAPCNAVIKKFVHQLFKRLQQNTDTDSDTSQTSAANANTSAQDSAATDVADDDTNSSKTLQQQLEAAIMQSTSVTSALIPASNAAAADRTLLTSIKAEMSVYESTGQRGRCLNEVYNYLLTVPPTSVEAERAFSAAGLLCTKLRSKLDDKTVDTLCFLRTYYKNTGNIA